MSINETLARPIPSINTIMREIAAAEYSSYRMASPQSAGRGRDSGKPTTFDLDFAFVFKGSYDPSTGH